MHAQSREHDALRQRALCRREGISRAELLLPGPGTATSRPKRRPAGSSRERLPRRVTPWERAGVNVSGGAELRQRRVEALGKLPQMVGGT